jgi:hypothetical protein
MRTFMALLSGACLVISGCPLAMEDSYVTGGETSGGNDAAAHEADSDEPIDFDASTDAQADTQIDVAADAAADAAADVAADAVDRDAAEDTEVETAPACGKPCGKECERLCEPGEPCGSHKDCAGDAECKKNDLDVKACELDD